VDAVRLLRIAAAVCLPLAALLLAWGVWLLATDDPDGGRHPVGAVLLGLALVLAALGLVFLGRSRRR
jgi:uncharacterized membrane protein